MTETDPVSGLSRRDLTTGVAIGLFALIAGTRVASGQSAATDLIPESFLEQVRTWMLDLAIPGAAIGVAFDGQTQTGVLGVNTVGDPAKVTTDALFQIGSISKTVTSTVLMQLIEEGSIALDDRVRKFIPDFAVADAEVSENVTIRHLVTHTTGFDVYPSLPGTKGDDALQLLMDETSAIQQVAPLGGPFSYSNLNAAILGRVLEVVTDQTFDALVQKAVFEPLGMSTAVYDTSSAVLPATGHETLPDGSAGVVSDDAIARIAWPAGGITCSIEDLLRFGMFHAAIELDVDPILSAESRTEMQEPLVPGGSFSRIRIDGIATSWLTVERSGARIVLHDGGTEGQQSLLVIAPDDKFACAILTNSTAGGDLALLVARWLLTNLPGTNVLDDLNGFAIDPAEISEYFGSYVALDSQSYTVETAFVADGPPRIVIYEDTSQTPVFLDSLKIDVWYRQDGFIRQYVDFVRDERGDVGWIRIAGRLIPKVS